jgi:ABC-2 type transport system permease protein
MLDLSLLKKEFRQSIRTYRILILAGVFFFFAFLDPFMNRYLLPLILAGQFPELPSEMLEGFLINTQRANIRAYMGDLFEIGTLAVAFTLSGLLAAEIRDRTLIFSVCSGKRLSQVATAKLLVYGALLMLLSIAATGVNALYAGLLFSFEITSFAPILKAGILEGLFFIYLLSALLLFGALVPRPIPAALLGLAMAYVPSLLGGLLNIERFLPDALLSEASLLTWMSNGSYLPGLIVSLACILLFWLGSILVLRHRELSRG